MNLETIAVPTMRTERLLLRPFVPGDEYQLQGTLNDKRVARDVSNIPFPYTMEHARAWVAGCKHCVTADDTRVDFAIEMNGKLVGSVAFINIESHKAQVSMWASPRYWGQGVATEALQILVQFGFEKLNLLRIYAYHYSGNQASEKVLTKVGFQYEGCHVGEWAKEIDGKVQYFDSHMYAIINRNFKSDS